MSVDLATELREYTKLDYKGNNCYKIRARLIRQLKEGKDIEKDNIFYFKADIIYFDRKQI